LSGKTGKHWPWETSAVYFSVRRVEHEKREILKRKTTGKNNFFMPIK
jgi:hypothetical protein